MKSKPATILLQCCLIGSVVAAQPRQPGERAADVGAIAGVIAEGARWERAWAGFDNADGLVGTADGGLLFAQEQPSRIRKLTADGADTVFLEATRGGGSISVDRRGRLLVVQREEPTAVAVLAPERRVLAAMFADGRPLGRLNDLTADARGGAYFTVGGAYYVDARGRVSTIAADIRANGIILSPDETTLYVTDAAAVLAFDVLADGTVSRRRLFGRLRGDAARDGMTVDDAGRVYVTAGFTIQVFSAAGEWLGTIPTPRQVISIAFSGPRKQTLFAVGHGAVGADGIERTERPAKTIYRIPMLASGFGGRPK